MTNKQRIHLAYFVAILVDIIQIPEFLAVFATVGMAEVIILMTDILAAITITSLIGWHWMLLPSVAAELVPGLNLLPTWTLTVYAITREKHVLESKKPAP